MISPGTNTTSIAACASMDFPQPSQARPQLPEIYKYVLLNAYQLLTHFLTKKLKVHLLFHLTLSQIHDVLN